MVSHPVQNVLVFLLFATIFLTLDRSEFFAKNFPNSFVAPKSSAQLAEGDLYGTCAPIEQLKHLNAKISPILQRLKQTPFFRTYKINLERECPFWAQQRLCNNNKCQVCESDEQAPQFWQSNKLERQPQNTIHEVEAINSEQFSKSFTKNIFGGSKVQEKQKEIDCPQNDKEWCVEDQDGHYGEVKEEDYILVNLLENEETFTAYEGGPIWEAIYQENCLLDKVYDRLKHRISKTFLDPGTYQCSEATLLFHLMSGLHASVNTHISEGFEDPKTLELTNNSTYFNNSVGKHPARVRNLHFIFAAVVKAVGMMEQTLVQNDYTTGLSMVDDLEAKRLIINLLKHLQEGGCEESFQEKNFFQGNDLAEMELLTEIQYKFYNISRVMDCISCDKCRLNGKVQVRGLATALKILFIPDSKKNEILKQVNNQEIVSIIQLLSKLSESLDILIKNMNKEIEFEKQVFMCQMIATFATSTLLSFAVMLACGYKPYAADDVEENEKVEEVKEASNAAVKIAPAASPKKRKGKKTRADKLD